MVAAGRTFMAGPHIRVRLNNPGFVEMRKDPALVGLLRTRGETWVLRLNEELHLAQKARKQPIADGYKYYIHTGGSRARLYIVAFTARAQAHEKKHSSILKLMETSGYDVVKHADLTPAQQRASRSARARSRRDEGTRRSSPPPTPTRDPGTRRSSSPPSPVDDPSSPHYRRRHL